MIVLALVVAAVLGLVIGSFLNVVAYRAPAGVPLTRESRCPSCDAPIRAWQNVPVLSWLLLRGRCALCGEKISMRYPLVEIITGVAFFGVAFWGLEGIAGASVTTRFATAIGGAPSDYAPALGAWAGEVAGWLILTAFVYFAAISVVLAVIDLDVNRLPNAIVLPAYVVVIVLLAVASVLTGEWSALIRAGIGMAAMYLFYFILRVARPGGMGGGDVKLAGVIGLLLGWLGWAPLVVGAFAAFVLGGLFGVALMVLRRAGRKSAIPFGPWMLVGAWVGIIWGQLLGDWYLGVLHV